MKHPCPGRSMTGYVVLGIITFMISGVTSAQIIIAEQQSDSAPWLLDKTAQPLRGGKDDAKTPEPPPADVGGSDEAKTSKRLPADAGREDKVKTAEHVPAEKSASRVGQEVSDESSSSSGWLPPGKSYGSCRHAASDQEDLLCTLGRILFGSNPSGPNRDMDENISAGGAGG